MGEIFATGCSGVFRGARSGLAAVNRWHDLIGDHTYADAILDRLIHNAHRIELAGESIRKTRSRAAKKD